MRVDTSRRIPQTFVSGETDMKEQDDRKDRARGEGANSQGARDEGANSQGGRGEAGARGAAGRELLLMRAGGRAFAVFSDEAGAVAAWAKPTPLPHAPASVLGVVSVRGRIRTVLDPLALLDVKTSAPVETDAANALDEDSESAASSNPPARNFIVPLRGDEQLALAVEAIEHVDAPPGVEGSRDERREPPVRAAFRHGDTHVLLIDPSQLFEAAMRGTERRRPRMKP